MTPLFSEARRSVVGVFRLAAFREDWRDYFDASTGGLVRSFSGIILALPAWIFTVFALNYLVAENPANIPAESRLTWLEGALTWARYWIVFPVVAALVCAAAGFSSHFARWTVVQNWTVFVLVHIQALIVALYPAGLADAASISQLVSIYIFVRMAAFWRVAHGALEVTPVYALALAGIPFLVDTGLRSLAQ